MKNLNFPQRSGLTLVFTIVIILFLVDSFSLSKLAGRVPQATLAITLLLLIAQLLVEYKSGLRQRNQNDSSAISKESDAKPDAKENPVFPVIAQIIGLLPMVWLFGMSAGAAIFCLVTLRWHAEESWKFSIIFSLGLGFILHAGFTGLFHIALYTGVIARILA